MAALSSSLAAATLLFAATAIAQDAPGRKELRRVDLPNAPGLEMVLSISEYNVGDELPRHFHYGVESGYVVDGGIVQPPSGPPIALPTGAPILNMPNIPHAGFKIVGDRPIRLFTVHVVEKGKPLYEWVKQ